MEFELGDSSGSGSGDEKTEFVVIPEDTMVEAELLGMEKKKMPFQDDNGNDVFKVEWTFKITEEGEYKNRRVWGQTSTIFTSHEDCKMRAWVQEILAVDELSPGFKFKTGDLVNEKARIVIGQRSYTTRDGEARTVNTVKDVIRARAAKPAAAPMPETVGASAGSETF